MEQNSTAQTSDTASQDSTNPISVQSVSTTIQAKLMNSNTHVPNQDQQFVNTDMRNQNVDETGKQSKSAVQNKVSAQNSNADLATELVASLSIASEEEQRAEKLLNLERRVKELYELEKDSIADKEYSFEFLKLVRESVKCYKKMIAPGDSDVLMAKGLDPRSELPQKSRPRSATVTNASNSFFVKKQYLSDGKKDSANSLNWERKKPAENAWKPKHLTEEEKLQALREDIHLLLDKITPTTYNALIKKFKNMNVGRNESTQQIAIDAIFSKAIEKPEFWSLYAKLCSDQVDGNRFPGSFFDALTNRVQKTFKTASPFDADIKKLTDEIEHEMDEKKRSDLKERFFLLQNKKKRYIVNIIKFVGHLYTVDLIDDQIIVLLMYLLHKMFMITKNDIWVQIGIKLLKTIAKIYFSQEKTKKRQEKNANENKDLDVDNVVTFICWVLSDECKSNVSVKTNVMIRKFEEFVKAGFTERNANNDSKKLTYLHADICKERAESELQQKQQMYTHRPMKQGKKVNAPFANTNVENTAPAKKPNVLEQLNKQNEIDFEKTPYFAKKENSDCGAATKLDWT